MRIRPVSKAQPWLTASLTFVAALSAAGVPPGAGPGHAHRGSDPRELSRPAEPGTAESHAGLEIVQHGGYPELRVDAQPFFIDSAAFFYERIPRDLWETMLNRYRALGINTIDIYIPWNWHEPQEGEFDFDGHTNPRRDLRSLLALITEKGFKLIARPGPEILNEWRHGGYPGWLLDRPEYKMDPLDWIEGRYAPLDNLNAHDAETAARGWLNNPTHMEQTRVWLGAVAKTLAPYSSHTTVHVKSETRPGAPREVSGPLLFVQLGDDFAIGRTNRVGPEFWKYVEELRGMLAAGGLNDPVFINPTDMRVSAEGSSQEPAIGVMGQWYMPREAASADSEGPLLTSRDASEIELFTEELKTQPSFPPVIIEYQAGWYTPADDDRPRPNSPENTLVGSRLLIGNGIHGLNYFPLQDTFTPAGYSVPWANRSYRWDAALSPDGDAQPRLQAVRRNGQLLEVWGSLLAASHKRADLGIIYPLGAYPRDLLTPKDISAVSESVMRIERLGVLATVSSELLDPQFQPVEQLLRDPLLLLPVFDPEKPQFQLSERAQQVIVDYVRRGGTLLVFPLRPSGKVMGELWKDAPSVADEPISAQSAIRAKWKFGGGEVIESSKDFYSWISLDKSLEDGRAQKAFAWAKDVLQQFLAAAGLQPALKPSGKLQEGAHLIVSEIVTNEGTGLLGNRTDGEGFLSVTNISDHMEEATFEILSPLASARGSSQGDYSTLDLVLPARESLLLPLKIPLCSPALQAPCTEDVSFGGAEFLESQMEGKTLELTFYVPARAEIHLHVAEKPSRVALDETDAHPDSTWTPTSHEFRLTLPRGAAPNFRRTVKLDLPGILRAERGKKNTVSKAPPEDLDVYVVNAVRFPTSGNAFLRTVPALIVPDADQKMNVLLMAENRNQSASGSIELSFDKPLHGTKNILVPARGTASELIEFRQGDIQGQASSSSDHLFRAAIEVRVGRDHRVLPLMFLLHSNDAQEHYRFDFDRDGRDEWVLENDRLRLIVSPESGGRAIALMDKLSGGNLSTSVGLFRDNFSFTENPPGINEARRRGRYGLFNRPYVAEWGPDSAHPVLKLRYTAADVFPAGAVMEKTIEFEGSEGVGATYRVALHAGSSGVSSGSRAQSFIVVNSFPADASDASPTRFCWQKNPNPQAPAHANTDKTSHDEPEKEQCEDFVRDGKVIVIPEGVSKVEIRSAAQPRVEMAWDCDKSCGRLEIEPKYFSALFRLEFPTLVPGADAAQYSVHIRILSAP
jgi:hypothetical protein